MEKIIPKPLLILSRILRNRQRTPVPLLKTILFNPHFKASLSERLHFIKKFIEISEGVSCGHTQGEISTIFSSILSVPESLEGAIVEAGCYQGGSTAKISIAARKVNRRVVVFDSFEGIPPNQELKDNGRPYHPQGSWKGTFEQVKNNVSRFGCVERCEFVKGWFKDTMPHFSEPIALTFVDVDLVASTRTCLINLYPLISPGGMLFSHDGHLEPVRKLYDDDQFWENEVHCHKPYIEGLGTRKLLKIVKPAN